MVEKQAVYNSSTFSVRLILQTATSVALFLSVYQFSPIAAIIACIVLAPAIARTAWAAEKRRSRGARFTFRQRVYFFLNSILLILCSSLVATIAFAVTSFGFGLLAMLFGVGSGMTDMAYDTAILGTIGGMAWGLAAFLFVFFAIVAWYWNSETQAHDTA
jgi:hypothetical protein